MAANLDRSTEALILDNQYVGQVVGNILDLYDNHTYNLKLYFKSNPNPDSIAARDGEVESEESAQADVGFSNPQSQENATNEIVVIAQTGVTASTIDNLEIRHVQQGSGQMLDASFTVTEPGSVSLMDQMVAAKQRLGVGDNDTVMYLDIVFRGLRSDETDNDAAGEPVIIAGPYTYRLSNVRYGLNISDAGAVYNFYGVMTEELGKTDEYYRIPGEIETTGTTITEHVEKYVTAYNRLREKMSVSFNGADEIVIDLGALVEGQGATGKSAEYVVKDQLLTDTTRSEDINRVFNEQSTVSFPTTEEYLQSQVGPPEEGDINIPVSVKIIMKEGSTVEDFISTLLAMNDDFFQKSSRIVNVGDPDSFTVDKDKAFVHWFRIITDVEYLEYDKTRRAYRKRIYFKPTIYKEGKANIGLIQQEFEALDRDQTNRRIAQLGIYKAYEYLFTGRNDQILGFEMNIDEAFVLELALPDFGDFSASASAALAPSLNPNESNDNVSQGLAQTFAFAQESVNRLELLKSLKQQDENGYRDIVSRFGSLVGLSDESIAAIQSDTNSAAATALSRALSNRELAATLANEELRQRDYASQFGVSTTSDVTGIVTGIDGVSRYVPESSGTIYSSELVSGLEGFEADVENAISEVQQSIEDADFVGPHQQRLVMSQAPDIASGATYERGTIRNTAFSHLMSQHKASAASFMEVNLEVRGDPWYIGKETFRLPTKPAGKDELETDENGAIWNKGTNQLFLSVASPKRYDFDVEDEDLNSGLYDYGGLNFMMSGIYDIMTCTSHFVGGQFTQTLRCTKHPLTTSNFNADEQGVTDSENQNDG